MSESKIVVGKPYFDEEETVTEQSYFDRQERISWWDQQKLFNARVLVIGAGALGNEVLKNLALLGIGRIVVIDFDVIEDSNLSRTVLFRSADAIEGANKAHVAAERTSALNPNPNAEVRAIHGNVVWELGAGVYRHADLVLGCLDNLEARMAVNLGCWRTRKTWIDGGMWELSGSVMVYDSSEEKACYECSMTPKHYRAAKVRYSCANATVRTNIRQGKEPTTQTTSAVVAAIQSQEAVKLLHNIASFPGRRLVFNGASHVYTDDEYAPIRMSNLTLNPTCLCHGEDRLDEVLELPGVTAEKTTAGQLLQIAESDMGLNNPRLEFGRPFVVKATCSKCEQPIILNRPLYKLRDVDAVCPHCEVICPACGVASIGKPDCPNCGHEDINGLRLEKFHTITKTDAITKPFLNYTLMELGIPPLHILAIHSDNKPPINIELTGDLKSLWG